MQTCHFYLLRHGKVEGEPALNGHTDKHVNPIRQKEICTALCDYPIAFDQIISSPLRRCADLALLLKTAHPTIQQSINNQIQEMSFGIVDGQPFEKIKDKWPLLDAFWQDPAKNTLPQAETLASFYQRISLAWSDIIKTDKTHTLMIAHGGVIRMILANVLQVDWKNPAWHANLSIANNSLTHIQINKADQYYISVKSIGLNLLS